MVLAEIRVTGSTVSNVDYLVHRRFTAAFGNFYYMCRPGGDPQS